MVVDSEDRSVIDEVMASVEFTLVAPVGDPDDGLAESRPGLLPDVLFEYANKTINVELVFVNEHEP